MSEKIPELKIPEPKWILDLNSPEESGELNRVAGTFRPDDPETIIQRFYENSLSPTVQPLDAELLGKLENTDANDISIGDFDKVAANIAEQTANDPLNQRDWEGLKDKMMKGEELNMPIIVKYGDIFHLMSGNTRLTVARALGIVPTVAIVDISELD